MNYTFILNAHSFTIKKVLAALCLILVCFNSFGQVRYTWRPTIDGNWNSAANWLPVRALPASDDILVFDGTVTPNTSAILDFAATQTIGQLIFTNAVSAAINTGSDRTLNIGTAAQTVGLQIGAGAVVKIIGTNGSSSALMMQLGPGVRASIAGRLEFLGNATSNSTHSLLSATTKAIEFTTGSYFLSGTTFDGFPFGSLTAQTESVVFRSGATFEQAGGRSVFGERTYAVAVFDLGSLYLYTAGGTGNIGLSGRTFGYLTINANRAPTAGTYGANKVTIQNDLTIAAGTHTFNVKELELKGNLLLSGGNLIFTPGATNSLLLTMSGAAAQVIAGPGTLTASPNMSLTLNNAAGLTLQRPLQINGNLVLTQGLLTTTATNSLTLGPLANTSVGSVTSFVNGPLSRVLAAANAATNLQFPIGSGTAYRPLILRAEQTDATATTYTAQQFNQAPTVRAMPTAAGSLQRVSAVRYFNVTNGSAGNFKQGAITLAYDLDDKVDAPAKLRIAKSDNAGNWLDLGGMGSASPTGSIASIVAFTSFSDFVLASTEATGGPGNNPLPVSLTSFTARREPAGVRLRWATATERNNGFFEIQRSLDGQVFTGLDTLPGYGNSSTAHDYTWLDGNSAGNGLAYYRLRQVDADKASTYSAVVAVKAGALLTSTFPNPAHDHLNFSAPAGDSYRLLDAMGRPVLTGKAIAGLNTLNLSNLRPGIYHLEVIGAQGPVQHRVIKNEAGR